MLPTPRRPPPGTAGLAPNTGVCGVGRYVELGKKLGQAVVVDSRPGAGGSVGGLLVSQAPAHGYMLMLMLMLMLSNSTPISIGAFALEKQPYDPVEGFTHIALISRAPCVVMANQAELQAFSGFEAMQKLHAWPAAPA